MSSTARIVRFHKTGPAEVLQFDELPIPAPGRGEVLLRVKAVGLNRAEIMFRQGALHLETIATVHGNAALIPYRFPDLTDLYYLGFCHGPAGTARTFFELHKVTGDAEYQLWTDRLAQDVIQSGIPENQTPG
jgi:hypothetical protein